jgi:hypothetical protein
LCRRLDRGLGADQQRNIVDVALNRSYRSVRQPACCPELSALPGRFAGLLILNIRRAGSGVGRYPAISEII